MRAYTATAQARMDTRPPLGYEVCDTGGGCRAYRRDLDDGTYLLVSDENGGINADPHKARLGRGAP